MRLSGTAQNVPFPSLTPSTCPRLALGRGILRDGRRIHLTFLCIPCGGPLALGKCWEQVIVRKAAIFLPIVPSGGGPCPISQLVLRDKVLQYVLKEIYRKYKRKGQWPVSLIMPISKLRLSKNDAEFCVSCPCAFHFVMYDRSLCKMTALWIS